MRVATWNLDHASNGSRPVELQLAQITAVAPDLVVLTETCDEVDLTRLGYHSLSSARNCYGKYYCVLWSSFPVVRTFPTFDQEITVCAELSAACGNIIVYGTVIPYHDDKVRDRSSRRWQEPYRVIEAQGQDWLAVLRETRGKLPLIVAGDFNQTRDGSSGGYGTKLGRELFSVAMRASGLSCLTTEDYGATGKLKVDPRKGWVRNNIDHICASETFVVTGSGAWDHFDKIGVYLSDHNGVYVDLDRASKERV
jgi:hypothetical protein